MLVLFVNFLNSLSSSARAPTDNYSSCHGAKGVVQPRLCSPLSSLCATQAQTDVTTAGMCHTLASFQFFVLLLTVVMCHLQPAEWKTKLFCFCCFFKKKVFSCVSIPKFKGSLITADVETAETSTLTPALMQTSSGENCGEYRVPSSSM